MRCTCVQKMYNCLFSGLSTKYMQNTGCVIPQRNPGVPGFKQWWPTMPSRSTKPKNHLTPQSTEHTQIKTHDIRRWQTRSWIGTDTRCGGFKLVHRTHSLSPLNNCISSGNIDIICESLSTEECHRFNSATFFACPKQELDFQRHGGVLFL